MKNKIEQFENHLTEKGYSKSSCSLYCYFIDKFLEYVENKGFNEEKTDYRLVLKYVTFLRRTNNDRSIISHLNALKHYFNFIGFAYNPIKIKMSRTQTIVPTNTLTREQLQKVYDEFPCGDRPTQVRNKVLFGLFVFQGIRSKEVKLITVGCIDLEGNTINIPNSNKSNGRILQLDKSQLKLLKEYLGKSRTQISCKGISDSLFVTQSGKNNIKGILNQMYPKLGKLPLRPTLDLIRTSVIKNWLKQHDLRIVQYMAGHRYISSTERYLQPDAKRLRGMIEQYHPIQ